MFWWALVSFWGEDGIVRWRGPSELRLREERGSVTFAWDFLETKMEHPVSTVKLSAERSITDALWSEIESAEACFSLFHHEQPIERIRNTVHRLCVIEQNWALSCASLLHRAFSLRAQNTNTRLSPSRFLLFALSLRVFYEAFPSENEQEKFLLWCSGLFANYPSIRPSVWQCERVFTGRLSSGQRSTKLRRSRIRRDATSLPFGEPRDSEFLWQGEIWD